MITPQMGQTLAFLAHINGWVLDGIFFVSLVLATAAQILAYRGGDRIFKRHAAMWCGIIAVWLLFGAGQIAGARLTYYMNGVSARSLGGAL
jgi:hypothetical protein